MLRPGAGSTRAKHGSSISLSHFQQYPRTDIGVVHNLSVVVDNLRVSIVPAIVPAIIPAIAARHQQSG